MSSLTILLPWARAAPVLNSASAVATTTTRMLTSLMLSGSVHVRVAPPRPSVIRALREEEQGRYAAGRAGQLRPWAPSSLSLSPISSKALEIGSNSNVRI